MNILIISVLTLLFIGTSSAIILFLVSNKFKVFEDPKIDEVEAALPAANCGGCGFPGCRGFAVACVNAETLDHLVCTVGGLKTMENVANILGKKAGSFYQSIAVVRCGGTCEVRPQTNQYDGVKSCLIAHNLYGGHTGCTFGCLGYGDCEVSCKFDAIHINPVTKLPEVDEEKCTACNACVKACPKAIIELRGKGVKSRRIYVNCINKNEGDEIQESCSVACIGCEKCFRECAFEAITLSNNLAYIDSTKCTLCRKCVDVCPTHAIVELNFPPRRVKNEAGEKIVEPVN
jgi:Na+-translocating ferredoxin:NAD+ oxidoreductase RNF subunit RnfB